MSERVVPCSWLALCALVLLNKAHAADAEVHLTDKTVVRFASLEEATAVMTARDEFIQGLTRFDLECRLQTNQEVSVELLLEHIPTQILEWTEDEQQQILPVLDQVRDRLKSWQLPFPETVLLVKTTGKEDAGAAYCRSNAVVLPQSFLPRLNESVMLHELFHILSSANPQLRQKLYSIVGFNIGQTVELPGSLQPIKISNPDAPTVNCYIELEYQEQRISAVPLLTANAEHFDPQPGHTLFNYMQFHLLVVEQQDEVWRAKKGDDGKPILLDPQSVPSFFEKIGRNTNYIIHPEEVLADNFVHLLQGKVLVQTPRILTEMADIFKETDGQR
jgi:hypothetical protein